MKLSPATNLLRRMDYGVSRQSLEGWWLFSSRT